MSTEAMNKLICICGERYFDEKCFVMHWQNCESSAHASCYKTSATRMAKAIQRFRNNDLLRDSPLRDTQDYADLCLAWKEFDDATEKKHRADLLPCNKQRGTL